MSKSLRLLAVPILTIAMAALATACGPAVAEQTEQEGVSTPAPTGTPEQAGPEAVSLTDFEDALRAIHEDVAASVVNIQVSGALPIGVPGEEGPIGAGSGFVWDTEGHIVTNDHVVADATDLMVTFSDGLSVPAETVGRDPDSDLAVIKVDLPSEQLTPVELADSTGVHVGQIAVAIGNPFGLDGTMTMGIVSALGRLLPVQPETPGGGAYNIPDVIQTDASINPGNSGGVLVDITGRVIGVPSAIISRGLGSSGIGFAIPSAIVEQVVPVLIAEGDYEHPWLGVQVTSMRASIAEEMGLPANQPGALVVQVMPDSPAQAADLQGGTRTVVVDGQEMAVGGDVVIAIAGEDVRDTDALITYQARHTRPGQTVTLTVLRNGETLELDVTMGARP